MKKILFFWSELTSTFWFIPVFIIIVSLFFAFGMVYWDSQVTIDPDGFYEYLLTSSSDSARSILTTISGAMIGVAGTVFSITLVALTLASSQFGPRLIKNFMYDRLNQVVLGAYISTFMYCMIVLISMKESDDTVFIPSISIFFVVIVTLGNLILLIIFIHHISSSIQADKIIAEISATLSKTISTQFPSEMGEGLISEVPDLSQIKNRYTVKEGSKCIKGGYLQYVDSESLMELAIEENILLELHFRPGKFLVEGENLVSINSVGPVPEKLFKKIQKNFIVGNTRTPQQDVEHSIYQMVEIASRALSPGINDPFTAIACIDNLSSNLCSLTKVKFPSKYRLDEVGQLRVIVDQFTFDGLLDAAFNQIRQFSAGNPSVAIRLMDAFITIHQFAILEEQKKAVKRHATMVMNVAKSDFKEPSDLKDLEVRFKKLK